MHCVDVSNIPACISTILNESLTIHHFECADVVEIYDERIFVYHTRFPPRPANLVRRLHFKRTSWEEVVECVAVWQRISDAGGLLTQKELWCQEEKTSGRRMYGGRGQRMGMKDLVVTWYQHYARAGQRKKWRRNLSSHLRALNIL